MKVTELRCPVCRSKIKVNDIVTLDIVNTITHIDCGSVLPIKDSGTFIEITLKYPFFQAILN